MCLFQQSFSGGRNLDRDLVECVEFQCALQVFEKSIGIAVGMYGTVAGAFLYNHRSYRFFCHGCHLCFICTGHVSVPPVCIGSLYLGCCVENHCVSRRYMI